MATEKTYRAISVTVPEALCQVIEQLNTPVGLLKPPKGTMSGLVSSLLTRWVEAQFSNTCWIDIQQVMRENPDRSVQEIREFFFNKAQQQEN